MQTGLQDRDEYRKEADQLLAVDAMRNADVWASVAMEVVIKCHMAILTKRFISHILRLQ